MNRKQLERLLGLTDDLGLIKRIADEDDGSTGGKPQRYYFRKCDGFVRAVSEAVRKRGASSI